MPVVTPPVFRRPSRGSLEALVALQAWEGVVTWSEATEFGARLFDMTAGGGPIEEASFLNDEVSDDDLKLVRPGSVFYWTIGRRTDEAGQRSLVSMIRFRRLPAKTPRGRIEAKARTAAILKRLRS